MGIVSKTARVVILVAFGALALTAQDKQALSGEALFQLEKTKAASGDREAQFRMAKYLLEGKVVGRDPAAAQEWLKKSAELGYPEAQVLHGKNTMFGWGTQRNAKAAVAWFRKAADQANGEGQAMLGICYLEGVGVERDNKQALAWIKISADQGHPMGLMVLSGLYKKGMAVGKDNVEAYAYLMLAVTAVQKSLAEPNEIEGIRQLLLQFEKDLTETEKAEGKSRAQKYQASVDARNKPVDEKGR
jgi:TPR repeat protein